MGVYILHIAGPASFFFSNIKREKMGKVSKGNLQLSNFFDFSLGESAALPVSLHPSLIGRRPFPFSETSRDGGFLVRDQVSRI